MAGRIVSLLGDPRRARLMGRRGREVVEQKFSRRRQLEETQALYERLLLRAQEEQRLKRGAEEGAPQESVHG
ncbi:MAG: hypothetical protein H0W99_01100 [Acidobacteria bacterium]|nr:hypothetical protein [Acidobacteriota bacterium]